MAATLDAQGIVIGIGGLVVLFLFGYGAIVSETILGIETTLAATWTFAVLFAVLAAAHLFVGQQSLAFGHGAAAAGWLFVLLGTTGAHVAIGVLVLLLAGCYIAIKTFRLQRAAEPTAE